MVELRTELRLKAGVDLGTTKISVMIAESDGMGLRVVGVGNAPAGGLKQGVVVDIEQAARAVEKAVAEAEQMAGVKAKLFNVGIAGEHIRSMNSRGVVSVSDSESEITDADVLRAMDASRKFSLPYDREIIHTLPQEYIVDEQRGIRHPAGMFGARLEARVHVVTASRPALDNVMKTLHLAGVGVGEIVLEPLASSLSVLTGDEREIGVMLLDIGGGTTDVLVYVDEGVVASGVIGLGGNNVTADIAYGLRTSQRTAESLKVKHGSALEDAEGDDELLEVASVGFRSNRRIAKRLLAGIIGPRVTELFSLIDEQITSSGLKKALGAGVVLTGGSSMLGGVRELAEQVFDLPVRVGAPFGVDGLSEVVSHPRFATGVGLLCHESPKRIRPGQRIPGGEWLRQSIDQLKRAIASFV